MSSVYIMDVESKHSTNIGNSMKQHEILHNKTFS